MTAVTLRQAPPQVEPKPEPEEKPRYVPRHRRVAAEPSVREPRTPILQRVRNVSIRIPRRINTLLDVASRRVWAPIRRRPIVAWAVSCLAASVAVSPWLPLFWLPVASSLFTGLGVWAACSYHIQKITDQRDDALKAEGALLQKNTLLKEQVASDSVLTQMLPQIRVGDEQ